MLYSEQKAIPTIYCDIYIFFIAIKIVLGINFYGIISIQINVKVKLGSMSPPTLFLFEIVLLFMTVLGPLSCHTNFKMGMTVFLHQKLNSALSKINLYSSVILTILIFQNMNMECLAIYTDLL